jgi:hypothetical protein
MAGIVVAQQHIACRVAESNPGWATQVAIKQVGQEDSRQGQEGGKQQEEKPTTFDCAHGKQIIILPSGDIKTRHRETAAGDIRPVMNVEAKYSEVEDVEWVDIVIGNDPWRLTT